MKKLTSLLLALSLALALAIPAFAENSYTWKNQNGDQRTVSVEVNATYSGDAATSSKKVHHLVITWNTIGTITYTNNGGTYTWDSENLKYTADANSTAGNGWSGSQTVTITVENRSNVAEEVSVDTTLESGITTQPVYTVKENDGDAKTYNKGSKETIATVAPDTIDTDSHGRGTDSKYGNEKTFTVKLTPTDKDTYPTSGNKLATVQLTISEVTD